jgi:hypothetical protein
MEVTPALVDFGGDYTAGTPIGHGSSATVYRARSTTFARDVAVKLFHGSLDDEVLRRKFLRECSVLGRLGDHPHIVSVFDSGFTGDRRPYLVMAYCDAGSLGGGAAQVPVLTPAHAVVVGLAVADALQAAHEHGILHRDVKPQNILRTRYGVVALADFGIAVRAPDEFTSAAATPSYAAPEVLLDHTSATAASDLYGLAATLYALLAGHPPIPQRADETQLQHLRRIGSEPIPPLPASVPEPLAEVILGALAKDPADRPTDGDRFAALLRTAADRSGLAIPSRLPAVAVPAAKVPASGVPAAGVPAAGVPAAGVPAAGVPAAGVPAPATPAAVFAQTTRGTPSAGSTPPPQRPTRRLHRTPVLVAAAVVVLVVLVVGGVGYALGRRPSDPVAGPRPAGSPSSQGPTGTPSGSVPPTSATPGATASTGATGVSASTRGSGAATGAPLPAGAGSAGARTPSAAASGSPPASSSAASPAPAPAPAKSPATTVHKATVTCTPSAGPRYQVAADLTWWNDGVGHVSYMNVDVRINPGYQGSGTGSYVNIYINDRDTDALLAHYKDTPWPTDSKGYSSDFRMWTVRWSAGQNFKAGAVYSVNGSLYGCTVYHSIAG